MKRLLPMLLLVFAVGVEAETINYSGGGIYVGQVSNGTPNVQGSMTWTDGAKYVGDWKDGKMHGEGVSAYPDGRNYVGEFRDDAFHGQGRLTLADGRKYVGEFKGGQPWQGTLYDKLGNVTESVVEGVRKAVN